MPFVAAVAAAAVETIPISARRQHLRDRPPRPRCCGASSLVSEDLLAAAAAAAAAGAARGACGQRRGRGRRLFRADRHGVGRDRRRGARRHDSAGRRVAAAGRSSSPRLRSPWSTSRLGLRRKTLLGIAEERGGRRGAGNAFANTGVAAIAAVLAVADVRDRAGAAGVRRGAGRRRQRHGRERDRQGLGPPHVSRDARSGRCRPGRRARCRCEGTVAGLVGAFGLGGLGVAARAHSVRSAAVRSLPARRSGRSPRACSALDARSAGRRQQRRPELSEHRHRRRRGDPALKASA